MCIRDSLATALVCGSALGTAAQTDPAKRFPHSQITADQWQIFLDEIKSRPGVQNVSRPGQPDILALAVPSENTLYFFTNGGPAHPAVVVEQVVQDGNGVSVRHTGYFAGSEQAFAKWFSTFHARDSAIREGTKSPR